MKEPSTDRTTFPIPGSSFRKPNVFVYSTHLLSRRYNTIPLFTHDFTFSKALVDGIVPCRGRDCLCPCSLLQNRLSS